MLAYSVHTLLACDLVFSLDRGNFIEMDVSKTFLVVEKRASLATLSTAASIISCN